MANYYCNASVVVPYANPEERSWLEQAFKVANGDLCADCGAEEEDCHCADGFASPEETGGFCWEDEGGKYWVYSEECIHLDVLVDIVEQFQVLFQKAEPWTCETAYTCSKPQLDAFGGCGVVVHRGVSHWFPTGLLIDNSVTEIINSEYFTETLPTWM